MPRVLIVEDEPDVAQLIDFNLRQAGLQTSLAPTAERALASAREEAPDLVILDLMLPDRSGAEVCRELKASPKTRLVPVIMLTAKGEEQDRVLGFEAGADDYVTKPFNVRELILRVQAVLRRTGGQGKPADTRQLGMLRLEIGAHRCFVGQEEIPLTLLEFRLLEHLMTRPGRVLSREQLLQDVWELTASVETRTVDTHVMRLREKLGAARRYLETVRGIGYRLVEPGELRRS